MEEQQISSSHRRVRKLLYVLYSVGFLFYIHFALTAYINSSFLESFINEGMVGVIYAIGSLIGLLGLLFISQILNRIGNYHTIASFTIIGFLVLVGLSFAEGAITAVILFALYVAVNSLIMYCIDVFVESYSSDSVTGNIRGTLLTSQNIGWVVAPLAAGAIVSTFWYSGVYIVAAFFMLAVFFILRTYFRNFTDPHYTRLPLLQTAQFVLGNKNIRNIYGVSFILQFIGSFMIIYAPIYLHEYIGFGWEKIGIIFAIMLTAYIFFELPEGRLADRKYGEKEILFIGMVIGAISVALISFIEATQVLPWIAIFFATRIGMSTMEIMSESYFFKQIKADDAKIISFFRTAAPLAYIVAPLAASIFLIFFPFKFLFVFLAGVVVCGLLFVIPLQDTK